MLLDGLSLRYCATGDEGTPLLLLHEMGGSMESRGVVLGLLPARQHVIRCDMRRSGEEYQSYLARFVANDPTSYAYILRLLLNLKFGGKLDQMSCPTLCVAGQFDLVRSAQVTQQVAAKIAGAKFLQIEG